MIYDPILMREREMNESDGEVETGAAGASDKIGAWVPREDLVVAAKELNKVLNLDPPGIDPESSQENIRNLLIEAVRGDSDHGPLIRADDKISDETRAVLFALTEDSLVAPKAAKTPKVKAAKTPKTPKVAKVKAAPKPKAPAKEPRVRAERVPREPRAVGRFKPLRRGTMLHDLVARAAAGLTLGEIAKEDSRPYEEKHVRWWLHQLRKYHGIDSSVADDRTVKLVFPDGKTLDDCMM